ncbi:DUF427 domain-containing protein [Rhodovibrionaceae bacterium A322]
MTARSSVTLANDTIHNPSDARHFMALTPISAEVRVYLEDQLLARSQKAVRLVEVGRAVYPPVIYLPAEDLTVDLETLDKSTHCPLKGDASYFAVSGTEIAWGYDQPFDFAEDLTGLRAFWPNKVRFEEVPLSS